MKTSDVVKALRELVSEGYARIVLDASAPGVIVPPSQRSNPLCLILEHQFQAFECDAREIRVTLFFGGVASRLVIPWTAVRTIVDRRDRMLFHFAPNQWAVFVSGAPELPPKVSEMKRAAPKSDTKARAARLGFEVGQGWCWVTASDTCYGTCIACGKNAVLTTYDTPDENVKCCECLPTVPPIAPPHRRYINVMGKWTVRVIVEPEPEMFRGRRVPCHPGRNGWLYALCERNRSSLPLISEMHV